MTTKFCKNCKWFAANKTEWALEAHQMAYARCGRTAVVSPEIDGIECTVERNSIFGCGKRARFFEAQGGK